MAAALSGKKCPDVPDSGEETLLGLFANGKRKSQEIRERERGNCVLCTKKRMRFVGINLAEGKEKKLK